jgi:hypothetical protein
MGLCFSSALGRLFIQMHLWEQHGMDYRIQHLRMVVFYEVKRNTCHQLYEDVPLEIQLVSARGYGQPQ